MGDLSVEPDIELLDHAIAKGEEAVFRGENKYTIIEGGQNVSV